MSAHNLLAELVAIGVQVVKDGDNLRVRGKPGTGLASYTEQIRHHKPELLAILSRGQLEAPSLVWRHVSREDVEASRPPADWGGALPATCAWLSLCASLGPCPRYLRRGPCRVDGGAS
jgi:hypothetical protein